MMQFLDKREPIVDIKEHLYTRVDILKAIIKSNKKVIPYDAREGGVLDGENSLAEDEIQFLTNLLDIIERS